VIDHPYRCLFTGFRWSTGGQLYRRNHWLFDENEKPGRVTDFYSVGCRFESCWDRRQLAEKNYNHWSCLETTPDQTEHLAWARRPEAFWASISRRGQSQYLLD